jgi:hypothetical protein
MKQTGRLVCLFITSCILIGAYYKSINIIYINICQEKNKCEIPRNAFFYSQSGEDKALYERYFKYPVKCNGVIVEIGASGYSTSISQFFEDQLHLDSILIEANPKHFRALIKNRLKSNKYYAAICNTDMVHFRALIKNRLKSNKYYAAICRMLLMMVLFLCPKDIRKE